MEEVTSVTTFGGGISLRVSTFGGGFVTGLVSSQQTTNCVPCELHSSSGKPPRLITFMAGPQSVRNLHTPSEPVLRVHESPTSGDRFIVFLLLIYFAKKESDSFFRSTLTSSCKYLLHFVFVNKFNLEGLFRRNKN